MSKGSRWATARMIALSAAVLLALQAAGAVEVVAVRKVVEGGALVFEVDFRAPADMQPAPAARPTWTSPPGLPRQAELFSDPPHRYPAHLVSAGERLTFIARGDDATALDFTLRYPTMGGGWKSEPLRIDFARAQPLTVRGTAREAWLRAQADSFAAQAGTTRDPTGFYTYAAIATRRQIGQREPNDLQRGLREQREFGRPDQYELVSGWAALQETTQLERMSGGGLERGPRAIPLAQVRPIEVRSHPFDEMRAGRAPRHSALAGLTPEDFWYARFGSLDAALELLALGREWGGPLLTMFDPASDGTRVVERTLRQLGLDAEALAQLAAEKQVIELAVIGSDPYLAEGSDVTVLFRARDPASFQAVADLALDRLAAATTGFARSYSRVAGLQVELATAPDRIVCQQRVQLDDVWVYSNSRTALQRVIEAQRGERGRLSQAADYRYMRAVVFPLSGASGEAQNAAHAAESVPRDAGEDGFIYLSDPFLRRVVGPELRIKQRRRLQAVTSLNVLTNAALLYGYRLGPSEPEFDDLVKTGALDPNDLYDPAGGMLTWDTRGVARSSQYGRLSFLTPLIELECGQVSKREKEEYDAFRERYSLYWRDYFDPVGMRITLGRTVRVETCILPLIESSAYNQLRALAGGEPIDVDLARFSPATIARGVWKLEDNARMQAIAAIEETIPEARAGWIGRWVTVWVEEDEQLLEMTRKYHRGEADMMSLFWILNATLGAGVHVADDSGLRPWLAAARAHPLVLSFIGQPEELAPQQGVSITAFKQKPVPAHPEREPSIFTATVGHAHYIMTREAALRRLIDHLTGAQPAAGAVGSDAARPGSGVSPARGQDVIAGNVVFYLSPSANGRPRPTMAYVAARQAQRAAQDTMARAWLLGRCGMLSGRTLSAAGDDLFGYGPVDPLGGALEYDARQVTVRSATFGGLHELRELDAPPADSGLGRLLSSIEAMVAALRFTDEGVMTTVEIRRR